MPLFIGPYLWTNRYYILRVAVPPSPFTNQHVHVCFFLTVHSFLIVAHEITSYANDKTEVGVGGHFEKKILLLSIFDKAERK